MIRDDEDDWVILPLPERFWPKKKAFDAGDAAFYCSKRKVSSHSYKNIWGKEHATAQKLV
jgi:hypothetical protein